MIRVVLSLDHTADHVFTDSLGSTLSGRERLKEAWAGYFSLFPDYRIEIQSAVAQDTLVLACGFASATHAASQETWRIPAAWRARVADGHIVEWQVYSDKAVNCFPERPNQSMKPTQHFVGSFRFMRTSILKVLGGLSLSR